MITTCPKCKALLSVPMPGRHACKKCGSVIHVGDPLRDEENRVVADAVAPPPPDTTGEEADDTRSDDDPYGLDAEERRERTLRENQATPRPAPPDGDGVAWDRVNELGFTEAVYRTTRDLILDPVRFFTDMIALPERRFIPLYGILFGIVGTAFNTYWTLILIDRFRPELEAILPPQTFALLTMPPANDLFFQILLSPVVSIILASFVLFGLSLLFGGEAKLHHFYRLTGFTTVLDLFYAVPFVGWAVVFVWRNILLIKGLRVITRLDGRKIAAVFVLYLVLSLLLLAPFGHGAG